MASFLRRQSNPTTTWGTPMSRWNSCHPQSENEKALVDAPLAEVVGCTFFDREHAGNQGAAGELSGCADRSFLEVSGYSLWLH